MAHAYDLGKANRADGASCQQLVREQLDDLEIGKEITVIRWAEGREIK